MSLYSVKRDLVKLKDKTECHSMKQDGAGWEDIPLFGCSREEAVFITVGRGGDLLILGFPAVK